MPVVFTPYLRKAKERIATDDRRERPERPDTDRTRPRKRWVAVGAAAVAVGAALLARRSKRDESAENSP